MYANKNADNHYTGIITLVCGKMAKLKAYLGGIAIIAVFILCFGILRTTNRLTSYLKLQAPVLISDLVVPGSTSKQQSVNYFSGEAAYKLTTNGSGFISPDVGRLNNASLSSEIRDLLRLIDEIVARDSSGRGPVEPEELGGYECDGRAPKFHGVEDLLCMTPPKFSPNYTNPCWQGADGTLRCLPYFQVIGMDKCGSTDLFDRIAKHPSVLMNKGGLHKETMWWSWRRYGHWLKSIKARRPQTFEEYLDYFSDAATTIHTNKTEHFVTGDGTPMDLWHMCGWADIPQNSGLQEPKYITPHLIRHINPGVKLIAIFRDPVERLFSDYFFLGQGTMTVQGFHNAVKDSIKLLHTCTRQFSLRTCVYSKLVHLKIKARLHLGFYSLFLRDWFRVFPREQFLILRTEDYSADTEGHLLNLYRFLGLRDLSKAEVDKISAANRKHVTKRKKKAGKMLDDTRLLLEHLYQGPKHNFAELLNDPRYLWAKS